MKPISENKAEPIFYKSLKLFTLVIIMCLPQHKKRAPTEQREKRLCENPLWEQRKVFRSKNEV